MSAVTVHLMDDEESHVRAVTKRFANVTRRELQVLAEAVRGLMPMRIAAQLATLAREAGLFATQEREGAGR
jgi:FixJ family two-component response regulator